MEEENLDNYKYNKKRVIVNQSIDQQQNNQKKKQDQQQLDQQYIEEEKQQVDIDEIVFDYRHLQLKPDYKLRPLLITEDKVIFLDVFHKLYRHAYEFIISIADPIERPSMMQKYKLTKFSLYTAMVLQFKPQDIIRVLEKLSKNLFLPQSVIEFIKQNTTNYGTAKFFLDKGIYYLDLDNKVYDYLKQKQLNIIDKLEEISISNKGNKILEKNKELQSIAHDFDNYLINNTQNQNDKQQTNTQFSNQQMQIQEDYNNLEVDEEDLIEQQKQQFKRFKIKEDHVTVCHDIIAADIPLIQEFDFMQELQQDSINDEQNPELQQQKKQQILDINLKGSIKLRFYQERALKNIFIDDKARSGLIILPCGAGKTIVGIYVIARIKGNTVIICDSEVSVEQWRSELLRCTTINSSNIIRLTGKIRDPWLNKPTGSSNTNSDYNKNRSVIIITTYYMFTKKRKNENEIVKQIKNSSYQWNLCIIDEVHKLPAPTFQKVLTDFKFRCKIGLTATPYREDQKINDLFYMIGPKLYEENWLDLVNQGFLAKPYCVEIRCKMNELFKQYCEKKKGQEQQLFYTANPTKYKALQYLIKIHEQMGDKILVFCDRPKIIEYFAKQLKYPVIHGNVNSDERRKILFWFQTNSKINTIFISRVGDTAIDLPQASVGIQIGFQFQSRRQEVQRLGRIMRPKDSQNGEYNAFWYTLVSQQTKEAVHCLHRQECLINQGFNYEIVQEEDMPFNKNPEKFPYLKDLDLQDYLFEIQQGNDKQIKSDSSLESEDSKDDDDDDDDDESQDEKIQYIQRKVNVNQITSVLQVNNDQHQKKK